ncbi:MAG: TonB family protein [Candidatus Acidiferrales bacterium]
MARVINRAVFVGSLLPEAKPRWDLFSAGFGLQVIAVTALVLIPMLMPQKLELYHRYLTTPIEAPPIVAWKPQPPPPEVKPAPVKQPKPPAIAKVIPKPVEIEVPKPKVYSPVFSSPIAKPATVKRDTKRPDVVEVAKSFPKQDMPTTLGSSAIPTLRKPREEVQTGGFGDPNGVPTNNRTGNHAPNVAQRGGYDMPNGPGYGNGTGGANGARGVVASTGFGNGVAAPATGGPARSVQQGGFADERAAAPTAKVKTAAAAAPKTTPVEILFKPKPVYSDAARAKKIEGEVLLQVVFSASGDVRIERIVQGLGYGLDDSAQAAARQIRFNPAKANGQPVDSTAVVHIVFQLAY